MAESMIFASVLGSSSHMCDPAMRIGIADINLSCAIALASKGCILADELE